MLVRGAVIHGPVELPGRRHATVDSKGLEPGVDDAPIVSRRAHHRGTHEQRVLVGIERSAVVAQIAPIVGIHEDVGADLQLGVDAARRLVLVGARAAATDHPRLEPDRLQGTLCLLHARHRMRDLLAPVGRCAHMLSRAVIGLQAGKAQMA